MSTKYNNLRIAIDGGAATGKSTVSNLVAKKLGIKYINTGQMYRLFAFLAIKENILNNEKLIYKKIKNLDISYDKNGKIKCSSFSFKISDLESEEISKNSSIISAMKLVRKIATKKQIEIAKEKGVLLEGRDIGTVIMKDADYKFFIKVDPKIAAQRRFKQLENSNKKVSLEDIYKNILSRNENDEKRKIAPLKPTKKSIIIDSSNNSAIEIANKIIDEVKNG